MPSDDETLSGSGGVQVRIGPRRRPRPEHKRLTFTADQWQLLASLATSPLPPPLEPAHEAEDRVSNATAAQRLRAAVVLTPAAEPTPAPPVALSLALLAASPVAVHVTVAGRSTAREVWWAMDTHRAVGVYLRADGGVDWVVCAASDAPALMSAVVPDVAALDPRGARITSALITSTTAGPVGEQRQRFTLPLELLAPADPLAQRGSDTDDAAGGHAREDRRRADALLAGCRGTLVARVYSASPTPTGGARVVRQEHSWLATAEGWLSLSRQPSPTRPSDAAPQAATRVRLTPVLPGDLPASLVPLLTDAFTRTAAARHTDTGQEGTGGGR